MPPETNFDRAFTEIPIRPPLCLKEAQIEIWEEELKHLRALETEYKTSLQLLTEGLTLELKFPHHDPSHFDWSIQDRFDAVNHMFYMMHEVAYFEGLLKDIQEK